MEKIMRSDDMIIASEQFTREEKYWLKQLNGELVKTTFPYDLNKTITRKENFDSKKPRDGVTFRLEETLCIRLNELSNQSDFRLFMILTSVLAVLLEKFSGHNDIILGTTIEKQKTDAEFVNTILPLRIPIKENVTFKDLLILVKQIVIDANTNQNYPIQVLMEQLDIPSTGDSFPLFEISITLENIHNIDYLQHINTNIDFSFSRSGELIDGIVYFNSSLYEKISIEGIVNHFNILLEQLLFNISLGLSEIEIISADEKQTLLYYYNDTKTVYPKYKKVHEVFKDQVLKEPDRIALIGPSVLSTNKKNDLSLLPHANVSTSTCIQVTYQHLNEKSRRLANILHKKGVTSENVVGIVVESSIETITVILGTLISSGAYLPIDPDQPLQRISYMLSDSNAKLLVNSTISTKIGDKRERTEEMKIGKWQGEMIFGAECLTTHMNVTSLETRSFCTQTINPTVDNLQPASSLAYVIYTSGTTGRPKGVMVNHRNISRLVKNTNFIDFKPQDRILQGGALDFDASTFEIWGALLNGLTLYLAPKDNFINPGTLKIIIAINHIAILWMTSALFNQMVQWDLEIFVGLRNLLVGGDVLSPVHINQVKKRFPGLNIINGYGPTENTTFSTTFLINRTFRESIPIGKPIANSTVYILNKYGKMQPGGIIGELYVGGDGVSRGYLNNPVLTREKIVDNPYILSERLYKTGDLALWRPDGNIDFLGRIDQQVKIRGFRIEPGEIKNLLLKSEGVKNAVIVARENEKKKGEKQLYAYLISNRELNISQLREWLLKHLPDYMVPAYFMLIDKIPLTPNGKIDKKALPKPDLEVNTDYEPPGEEIEKKLVEIWQEVLGLEKIGISHNFFEIGGDSIKAIQIISRLQKYSLKLNIRDLFINPTIKTLATNVKKVVGSAYQGIVYGKVPLTAIQKWLIRKKSTYQHHFNQSVMLYNEKGFAVEAIKAVFKTITRHHDALRMRFTTERVAPATQEEFREQKNKLKSKQSWKENKKLESISTVGNQIIQVNHGTDGTMFDMEILDLHNDEKENIQGKIHSMCHRIQRGIQLSTGPLVKLGLFKTDQGDHLLIVVHHLVIDGISWRILLEDFASAYQQFQQRENPKGAASPTLEELGEKESKPNEEKSWNEDKNLERSPLELPLKTDSFKSWAEKIDQYAQSSEILEELDHWKKLEESNLENLPKDFQIENDLKKNKYLKTNTIELDQRATEKLLREINHAYNTDINDILLTALGLSMQDWAGIDKVLVNLEGHGREPVFEDINISRTVGWFTTQFPILLDMSAAPKDNEDIKLSHCIKFIKEALKQIPNNGFSYSILKYITPEEKRKEINFQLEPEINFNFLGEFGQEGNINNDLIRISPLSNLQGDSISPEAGNDIAIDISGLIIDGKLNMRFRYNKYEYGDSTMQRLVNCYRSNLLKLIDHCINKEENEFTPSDFTKKDLDFEEMENILDMVRKI